MTMHALKHIMNMTASNANGMMLMTKTVVTCRRLAELVCAKVKSVADSGKKGDGAETFVQGARAFVFDYAGQGVGEAGVAEAYLVRRRSGSAGAPQPSLDGVYRMHACIGDEASGCPSDERYP